MGCGIKRSSNRIVNGVQAGVNEFPWIAGMIQILDGMETDSMCGGTLVADKWIVTAAHCLYKDNDFKTLLKPSEQVWVLGEHDWFDTSETKIPTNRFPVEKVLVHPKWDSLNTKNDIALIKLKTSADLTKYTPACLANTGDNFVGKTAWVYGWGQTAFKADFGSSVLLKLQVKVASNQECIDWSKKAFGLAAWELGTGQLCAGAGAGKDACKGDSGGPLTTDVGGRQVLLVMSVMEILARVLMLSLVPLLTIDNGLTKKLNQLEEPESV